LKLLNIRENNRDLIILNSPSNFLFHNTEHNDKTVLLQNNQKMKKIKTCKAGAIPAIFPDKSLMLFVFQDFTFQFCLPKKQS